MIKNSVKMNLLNAKISNDVNSEDNTRQLFYNFHFFLQQVLMVFNFYFDAEFFDKQLDTECLIKKSGLIIA